MAEIKPFRGIIYSERKVGNISDVVSPPYDVLTEEDILRYERRSKYNVVRLIQSRDGVVNGRKVNKYEMAGEYFRQWREEKVLVQDTRPCLYIYEHQFSVNNKQFRRIGFISAVKLEDFSSGRVLPHENTFAGPIEDRFKLTIATSANLCSIFSIFSDSDGMVMDLLENRAEKEKVYSAVDADGGVHIIYRVSGDKVINEVRIKMTDKVFLIADGHHRYETALRYRNHLRQHLKNPNREIPADYVMMYLTPMESQGLVILPIYRLIKLPPHSEVNDILKKSEQYFKIMKLNSTEEALELLEKDKNLRGFAVIFQSGVYLFTIKSVDIMDRFNKENYSKPRLTLNVSILHMLFIEHILGMSRELAEKNIYYSNNLGELYIKRENGAGDAIILLNPPTIQEIKAVAENRERMPHKSTFFYPKLLSGLVIRLLDE